MDIEALELERWYDEGGFAQEPEEETAAFQLPTPEDL